MLETRTLSVEEAAKILGIGITTAYAAIRRGEIPSIRIGGRLLVPKPALDELLRHGANRVCSSDGDRGEVR